MDAGYLQRSLEAMVKAEERKEVSEYQKGVKEGLKTALVLLKEEIMNDLREEYRCQS